MAQQVPSGTRFIGIATSVDLVERKSSVLNKQTEPYTIEDIILSVPAGPAGPQGVQGPAGPIGPVGPAGLNWQGAWVSGTSYVADDAVGYNGASWFCILATSGTTTPNLDTTHWALLASQGAQGIQGVQGATGPQGPAGNPATQTLQQTVDLGNTITASGYETIIAAGSIAVGTVGFGYTLLNPDYFQLNNGTNYINLNLPDVLTGNRTIKFPDAAGTIALTSDITGNQVTKVVKTTISEAQVLQLFTTPITILNSDDPLTVAYPISVYIKRNNGTPYTLAANSFSVINDAGTVMSGSLVPNPLTQTEGYFQAPISATQNASGSGVYKNNLYKLRAGTGNPTLGTGSLDVYTTYIEITL
jgi:hypothetical protein